MTRSPWRRGAAALLGGSTASRADRAWGVALAASPGPGGLPAATGKSDAGDRRRSAALDAPPAARAVLALAAVELLTTPAAGRPGSTGWCCLARLDRRCRLCLRHHDTDLPLSSVTDVTSTTASERP